jgi:hypothetical protein
MKSYLAFASVLGAAASLSAAVVTGGGTGTTGTGTTTPTTPTTPVVTPKPTAGTCQKPAIQPAIKPIEVKCEKKEAAKPAPIKSAAPACAKK